VAEATHRVRLPSRSAEGHHIEAEVFGRPRHDAIRGRQEPISDRLRNSQMQSVEGPKWVATQLAEQNDRSERLLVVQRANLEMTLGNVTLEEPKCAFGGLLADIARTPAASQQAT
jgi:hypothetical protein